MKRERDKKGRREIKRENEKE
jgi:hypothetical protein